MEISPSEFCIKFLQLMLNLVVVIGKIVDSELPTKWHLPFAFELGNANQESQSLAGTLQIT
jgi:hypothetical protein